MTTTTERDQHDTTPVLVGGAGLVPFHVLTWLRAAERLGVRFRVVGDCLEHEPGEFSRIGSLPPPALEFLQAHADELRRVVLATPTTVM